MRVMTIMFCISLNRYALEKGRPLCLGLQQSLERLCELSPGFCVVNCIGLTVDYARYPTQKPRNFSERSLTLTLVLRLYTNKTSELCVKKALAFKHVYNSYVLLIHLCSLKY